MKKLTETLGIKILAIILSYVTVLIFILSAAATAIMGYYKFYFSDVDTVKSEIMTDMAENEAHHAQNLWYWGDDLTAYYKDKNIYYEVYDERNQKITETNYSAQEYLAKGDANVYENIEKSSVNPETGKEHTYWDDEHIATVNIYVAKDMTKNDLFSVTLKIIELGFKLEYAVIFIMLLALIFAIALLCYLFCASGHRKGGEVALNYLDKVPFDIYTAVIIAVALMSVEIVANWGYDTFSVITSILLVGSIDYFIGLIYLLSFATRIKTGTLIKNNIIYYILNFFLKRSKRFFLWLRFILSNVPFIYKTVLCLVGLLIIEFICIIILLNTYWYNSALMVFCLIFANIAFVLAVLYFAVVMSKIKQGGEKIAGGELEHKIDTRYMLGDFKKFSESLNNINEGLQLAVNERMKSERFKTELITNVSHDIKTPLTSIVNYVDLIKKEKSENETVNGYIEVLDRQSSRLKKLVEDLVEASKASTGNISVNLTPCDIGVLLNQTVGEFEERLNKSSLVPIVNIPEEPMRIMADARHLWRVFDNIMNNVCKYALSGTRVYIDVKQQGGKAEITFRNISKYELNISADELMERFVRGDKSRNTEGSGLGLSIAKSLIELQNGNLILSVDGDLFKVSVRLPMA